jgi:hypothetical protein
MILFHNYTPAMPAVVASVAALVVIWVPGAIAARLLRASERDVIARIAVEIALGLSFWPILFLLTNTIGLAWNAIGARVFFASIVICVIPSAARNLRRRKIGWDSSPYSLLGMALILIVAVTRVTQVAGVAFPLWVDSVHHTMIVRLLVDHGRLPSSYAPYISDSTFYYHWGYHAVMAFIAWISGMTSADALPRLLLVAGQVINVLTFFAVYLGAKVLLRSRRAALIAATLATLVSLFPAYYVSWGRYTQLCGLLLLTPLASAAWQLARHPSWRRAVIVAMLSGGVLLIHVRIAVVFVTLFAILAGVLLMQRRLRGLAWCAAAGAAGLVIAAPWLIHLATTPQVQTILSPTAAEQSRWESSNAAPDDLLWAPHNLALFTLASGGLLGLTPLARYTTAARVIAVAWWLSLVFLLQTRKRRESRFDGWRIGIVVAWIALTATAINLDRLGLPRLRVVTNSAAIILLFLPLSIIGAHLIRFAIDAIVPPRRRRIVTMVIILTIALGGASTMIHIINPQTILVTEADRTALAWIRTHTPANARFAVGVQPWIGGSLMGIDGGYWIPLVAERASILPPGLYPWVVPARRVEDITTLLEHWYDASQNGDLAFLDTLRANGVTHIYFGPRNQSAMRSVIGSRVPRVYDSGGVEIFALQ